MHPKITIITVTYNSKATLERTIHSIQNQNYSNLEYLIVDGGSTDGTLDIIKKYEASITRWISEPDDGISDAFNKGIRMASGEIIGIINSDDGLCEGALKALDEAYEPDVDVYRGNLIVWNETTGTKSSSLPTIKVDFRGTNVINHPSTFITKRAYEAHGLYDVKCRYSMDYDMLLRLTKKGCKFKHVDHELAFFTLGGVTSDKYSKKRQDELVYVLKKNGANVFQVFNCSCVRALKRMINRVLGKNLAVLLRNSLFRRIR